MTKWLLDAVVFLGALVTLLALVGVIVGAGVYTAAAVWCWTPDLVSSIRRRMARRLDGDK